MPFGIRGQIGFCGDGSLGIVNGEFVAKVVDNRRRKFHARDALGTVWQGGGMVLGMKLKNRWCLIASTFCLDFLRFLGYAISAGSNFMDFNKQLQHRAVANFVKKGKRFFNSVILFSRMYIIIKDNRHRVVQLLHSSVASAFRINMNGKINTRHTWQGMKHKEILQAGICIKTRIAFP